MDEAARAKWRNLVTLVVAGVSKCVVIFLELLIHEYRRPVGVWACYIVCICTGLWVDVYTARPRPSIPST